MHTHSHTHTHIHTHTHTHTPTYTHTHSHMHMPTHPNLFVLCPSDPVFGCELAKLYEREKCNVPHFLTQFMDHIEQHGLQVVGIYRLSGNAASVQKLRFLVEQGMWNLVGTTTCGTGWAPSLPSCFVFVHLLTCLGPLVTTLALSLVLLPVQTCILAMLYCKTTRQPKLKPAYNLKVQVADLNGCGQHKRRTDDSAIQSHIYR